MGSCEISSGACFPFEVDLVCTVSIDHMDFTEILEELNALTIQEATFSVTIRKIYFQHLNNQKERSTYTAAAINK
jgi:hypothetical protein